MPVSLGDLLDAFLFVDFEAGMGGNEAFLCRRSGRIYLHSEIADADELPDDIEDDEKYIRIPIRAELDLGKPLVFGFMRQFLPQDYDEVSDIFRRKGAYARFKDLLDRRGVLDQWHEFESQAEQEALRQWCRDNSIELND